MTPFIAFEGLDGSGKSTLIKGLQQELQARGVAFVTTREPGGTPLADEIRELLLKIQDDAPVPRAELLLYEASRAQHVDKVIRPHLEAGHWVLCDRFTASSLAFQAGGRRLAETQVKSLNDFATAGCQPDLWVLLDLEVKAALGRIERRQQGASDRIESEVAEFHDKVRASFLQQAHAEPSRWLVLDAVKAPDILLGQLMAELRRRKWLD